MTKPRNKRLSSYDRDRLNSFAKKLVEASQDTTAVDVAYANAAMTVTAAVEREYPPRDMKILKKYTVAGNDRYVRVSPGFGDVTQFCYRDGDNGPLRPTTYSCKNHVYLIGDDEFKVVRVFEDAEKAFKTAVAQRLSDYSALIGSVNSFNEVANVWPEAEELRESICGSATAMVLLNEQVVARIKADFAARAESPT